MTVCRGYNGVGGEMMSIKISGMAVDMEVTEKGIKLLRVADKRCVHTVCVSDDLFGTMT